MHLAGRTDLDEKADLTDYAVNIEGVQNLTVAFRLTPSIKRACWRRSNDTDPAMKVTVQHVSVSQGGQAVVGNGTQNPPETRRRKSPHHHLRLPTEAYRQWK